ncbi:intein-containing Rv2578c family radical SAM protein [Conexibacter woesei]|uniref:Radical SAM domain protein n=1 Tax=Conexibacter woesei (strain DSM 14684 / CCUG 47730 / CIP 108061 / JCM 11494 / NBRC 100937 / ID131577) TaxID=469383 RepID=D3FE53_CONWI|nr:intein-containing Rv2578c family radical SAM protein [Conexibacter woesei]ADB51669.1 Radical SAM domain protein [Conexibacter woesei DSM 14684]
MRWDNLTLDADEAARLPGYRDAAVVRRFDAPEALDMRFYEVHSRSALNRVPERSRMPFRWTINPYRGCTHACVYCLDGETPILMADGRTRRLADLSVGDEIYGTRRVGAYRRYEPTRVLAHWSSVKPAFRVTLEDGTELVASGDHRFLTRRGWKHVTGSGHGAEQRPHLTTNDVLLGTGQFAAGPVIDDDYERGYVCGMVRGDGTIGTYDYPRAGRSHGRVYRFRLALKDEEALSRTQRYLRDAGIATDAFVFQAAAGARAQISAVRTQRQRDVEAVEALVRWPLDPPDSWCKGFLAGIFDAEGSCSGGVLRISNGDATIIRWIELCLTRFGFDHVVEPPRPNGVRCVRLGGGLAGRLRFFHLTDPAILRKRSMDGHALKTAGSRKVASVEPLGLSMRLYDITTGTGDFIANGAVSHNCFARPTHRYLDFDAGRDFEREIVVKVNVPEVLRIELARPSWRGEHVALGTNTDPYQWVEGRYRLMPGIWEALRDARNPCSVLTKSPLLLRDLGLMRELAAVTDFTASLSIPTLDEKAWRATEPHTPHPRARLEAVAELNRNGIPTGVLIAPLMPGINDAPEQVEPLLAAAEEAGAVSIGGIALHLRSDVRQIFMDWLRGTRPDLLPRYQRLYARGAYAPREERARLSALVRGRGRRAPTWRLRARERPALPGPTGRSAGDQQPPREVAPLPRLGAQQALF